MTNIVSSYHRKCREPLRELHAPELGPTRHRAGQRPWSAPSEASQHCRPPCQRSRSHYSLGAWPLDRGTASAPGLGLPAHAPALWVRDAPLPETLERHALWPAQSNCSVKVGRETQHAWMAHQHTATRADGLSALKSYSSLLNNDADLLIKLGLKPLSQLEDEKTPRWARAHGPATALPTVTSRVLAPLQQTGVAACALHSAEQPPAFRTLPAWLADNEYPGPV